MATYESHDFYCMNCGHRSIPIMRKLGQTRKAVHRKKLYCPFCKTVVNHIEVKNIEERDWFLEEFNKGSFKDEVELSLQECEGDIYV